MLHVTLGCVISILGLVKGSDGADIINGKEVFPPHSMPYMALLMTRNGPYCGGTLISPKWVLTAGHCHNDSVRIEKVMLGVHNLNEQEKDQRQIMKVKRRVQHPCYDSDQKLNDLMLIKLDRSVKESKTVKVQPLRGVAYPAAGNTCLVAGWGKTRSDAVKGSDVLMSVNVTVIDRVKCNSREFYNLDPPITSQHICAGSDGKIKADSCRGDSGGPLLCGGNVVGVTSFGKGCGLIKKPGVYAFLSEKQLKWIEETMKA